MLSINQLFNIFYKKNNEKPENDAILDLSKNPVIITLGLSEDYEHIDISVEFQNLSIDNDADMLYKSKKISEFLHNITSGGVNQNIASIMVDQLSDEDNSKMMETIVYHWLLLEKTKEIYSTNISQTPVVSPLGVFGKYIQGNYEE